MSDPFLGEIRLFAGNFPPKGWAFCDGSLMAISQNTALFSILGAQYGGNGVNTFGLPNLHGSVAIGSGQGPGLSDRVPGESGGSATVPLIPAELPPHAHTPMAYSNNGTTPDPNNKVWGEYSTGSSHSQHRVNLYAPAPTPNTKMSPAALGTAGNSQPHNNMQPFLAVSYIIALQGVFPQRD